MISTAVKVRLLYFLAQVFCPTSDPCKMLRGLVSADTSLGVEQIDGNQGDFTWMDRWTDIPTSFLYSEEIKLHLDDPGEHKECQIE